MTEQLKREDYVAIHTSDRANFRKCRRRWNWTSPTRGNLRPKTSVSGIYLPTWFGTGIHVALEGYYSKGADPVTVFDKWYQSEQVRINQTAEVWAIEHQEELAQHYCMGISMMRYYVEWAAKNDNFKVIHTERELKAPLGFSVDGKPVFYQGRLDAVVELENGKYAILDHKTASSVSGEDDEYFLRLEMDDQCTSYLWMAQETYDIEISYVIYNVLPKGEIKSPTLLYDKDGKVKGLSVDRQKEFTTQKMWDDALSEYDLWDWFAKEYKRSQYRDFLGEREFVYRKLTRRNRFEIQNAYDNFVSEAMDMVNPKLPLYPNPSSDWYCVRCPFRGPCLAMNDGSDYEEIIVQNYETNMVDGRYTS